MVASKSFFPLIWTCYLKRIDLVTSLKRVEGYGLDLKNITKKKVLHFHMKQKRHIAKIQDQ